MPRAKYTWKEKEVQKKAFHSECQKQTLSVRKTKRHDKNNTQNQQNSVAVLSVIYLYTHTHIQHTRWVKAHQIMVGKAKKTVHPEGLPAPELPGIGRTDAPRTATGTQPEDSTH